MPKLPKKPKATDKPHAAPEHADPARVDAGAIRVEAAREHLAKAREQLDAACRDLSDVIGASDFYRMTRACSDAARDMYYQLEDGIERRCFAAGGKFEGEKKHRSCGGTAP